VLILNAGLFCVIALFLFSLTVSSAAGPVCNTGGQEAGVLENFGWYKQSLCDIYVIVNITQI